MFLRTILASSSRPRIDLVVQAQLINHVTCVPRFFKSPNRGHSHRLKLITHLTPQMATSPASPSTTVTLDVLITVLSKLHLSDVISAPKLFDAIIQENAEPSKKGLSTSSAHRQAILQRARAKSEKRKKLLELTRSSFPDGEVPTPYANV